MEEDSKNSQGISKAFLADQMAGVDDSVHEIYGPKFNLYFTDRDVRVAFGTTYSIYGEDGEFSHFERRYQFAVWLPFKSAKELRDHLDVAIRAHEAEAGKPEGE